MRQSPEEDSRLPIDPGSWNELCGLLARVCDDDLNESDRFRLTQILDADSAARRYYLQYIAVHSALTTAAGCSAVDAQMAVERMTLDRFATCTTLTPVCELETSQMTGGRRWQSLIRWSASLSAALLLAMSALWWAQRASRFENESGSVADVRPGNVSDGSADPGRLVAEVTYVSSSAIWQNPNGSYAIASHVRSGQPLTIERGQIELTYSSGAKLQLTGPAEFLVQPAGGKLRRGELVARVPEAGHGFTIETPHGKVVDLGTEFGVVVDDFGVSQVSVFEGKVETFPTGTVRSSRDKIELTSGRAIQWTDESVIPISLQGSRYHRLSNDLLANETAGLTKTAIDDDFRGKPLDKERWKTLGEVLPTEHGLRLGGGAGAGPRPYLLTAQEFDPSYGAITVVCDLRFENVHDAENTSCAILTRSSDERSKRDTPWQDLLARSVSCRLAANSLSGEGMLEAGTKYEADRELTNISWGGFSRPQTDTLYRLAMRDDGLNVTFTVSLAGNQLVRKNITCRSLFRGNQNFIAFEGPSAGTVVIERLMISQDGASVNDAAPLASDAASEFVAPELQGADDAQQMLELTPASARLLVQDDFDDGKLNSNIWTILGDVVVRGGQVQLGLPNDAQHIDTWRARPYLLSKEQFDPADGGLIVLGKVTFAKNFLHGYGGSFAVMTRAAHAHGDGPGWENSILRRGIRSNFWPAAYGSDHSLEIHEKPNANTIHLSTAEGFQISPNSRSYYFQIVDDGRSATLTFIDAANPAVRKSVTHATMSRTLSNGYIGFESCWGSPVLLDNVRIYRVEEEGQGKQVSRD